MEIYPFDKSIKDVFTEQDISGITTDGITIRSGNKIIKLQMTEETVIDDSDSIRQELETKFDDRFKTLVQEFDQYKEQMKYTLDGEKNKLIRKQQQLEAQLNEKTTLPNLTIDHMSKGLAVGSNNRGGLAWTFKTVYAPKAIGNRRIDPTFAKRLVTPISIEVWTDRERKVFKLVVRQILGRKKFHHYHSMSQTRDCWGNFVFEGKKIDQPDDMIDFCQEVSILLETINDLSIGTNNPRGLSRLATIEKHLLKAEDKPEDKKPKTTTNSRNSRAGVDMEAQETVSEAVWST